MPTINDVTKYLLDKLEPHLNFVGHEYTVKLDDGTTLRLELVLSRESFRSYTELVKEAVQREFDNGVRFR